MAGDAGVGGTGDAAGAEVGSDAGEGPDAIGEGSILIFLPLFKRGLNCSNVGGGLVIRSQVVSLSRQFLHPTTS